MLLIQVFLQCNSFMNTMTQERCDKAADTCPFVCNPVSINMTQEMCDRVFFKDRLMLKQ